MQLLFWIISISLSMMGSVLGQDKLTVSCDIINSFIYPETVFSNPWKRDLCATKDSGDEHCCRGSVEDSLKIQANPNELLFGHIDQLRQTIEAEATAYRDLNLAGLSDSLRRAALSYRILDNSLATPETVVKKAAGGFLDSVFSMRDMPTFCKGGLHEIIRPAVQHLLQEIKYMSGLMESNWNLAEDLFNLIQDSRVSDQCRNQLIQAGLTDVSCKTCMDQTAKVPTCFNYCEDVVENCLGPFKEIIEITESWLLLYSELKSREATISERVEEIERVLRDYISRKMDSDDHFRDVCRYHFTERGRNSYYNLEGRGNGKRRHKRVDKYENASAASNPVRISPTTRSVVSQTPAGPTEAPRSAVNPSESMFDPGIVCYRRTGMVLRNHCWNGTWAGTYTRSDAEVTLPPPTEENQFKVHLPRLHAKLADLSSSISSLPNYITAIPPTTDNNSVDAQTKIESGGCRATAPLHTLLILILLLSWIRI